MLLAEIIVIWVVEEERGDEIEGEEDDDEAEEVGDSKAWQPHLFAWTNFKCPQRH